MAAASQPPSDKVTEKLNKAKDELEVRKKSLSELLDKSEPSEAEKEEIKRLRKVVHRLKMRVYYYEKGRSVKLTRYATDEAVKEHTCAQARQFYARLKNDSEKLKQLTAQLSTEANNS